MVLHDRNSSDDQPVVSFGQYISLSSLDELDGPVVAHINTCGGTVFCPEGKQDSLDLGLKLEERLHNIYLPAKLSIAVSGCDNQCAEACDKDIGIVGMEGGWDIFVGGSSGENKHPWKLASGFLTGQVLELVDRIVGLYRIDHNEKKKLSALIEGVGFENFKAKVLRQNEAAKK